MDIEQEIIKTKKYHKQHIDILENDIRDHFDRGYTECDWLSHRQTLLTGHKMCWNTLNDLERCFISV